MKKMPAGQFKARCLAVLDEVQKTKKPLLITKRGRPVAKLVPVDEAPFVLGRLEGLVRITGDLEAPIESIDKWEVLR